MTATPGYLRLDPIYRGDPYTFTLSATVDGVPETVVAGDALAQLRATTESTAVLAVFAVAVSGAVVTLSLTPTQTAALPPGEARFDFQPSATSETWVRGPVLVIGDVSRPTP